MFLHINQTPDLVQLSSCFNDMLYLDSITGL